MSRRTNVGDWTRSYIKRENEATDSLDRVARVLERSV